MIDQTQLFSNLALDPASSGDITIDFTSPVTGEIEITLGTGTDQQIVGSVRIEDAANRDELWLNSESRFEIILIFKELPSTQVVRLAQ